MLDCRVFDGSEELARIVLSGMCEISRKWGARCGVLLPPGPHGTSGPSGIRALQGNGESRG